MEILPVYPSQVIPCVSVARHADLSYLKFTVSEHPCYPAAAQPQPGMQAMNSVRRFLQVRVALRHAPLVK